MHTSTRMEDLMLMHIKVSKFIDLCVLYYINVNITLKRVNFTYQCVNCTIYKFNMKTLQIRVLILHI